MVLSLWALATSISRVSQSPGPGSEVRNDSFWDKMGTLGRKKKMAEVQQVEVEGKHAIDSPGMPKSSEVPPEEYLLEENEERSMIEPRSYDNPRLKDLISILIEWVNDELHGERIIVQDVEEDLYDGQVKYPRRNTRALYVLPLTMTFTFIEVLYKNDNRTSKLHLVILITPD